MLLICPYPKITQMQGARAKCKRCRFDGKSVAQIGMNNPGVRPKKKKKERKKHFCQP